MAAAATCLCVSLLFGCFVDLASSDQTTITAESGQNVTLTCRAPSDKTIRAVKWSRTDLGDEFVLLYRDEQLDPVNQHPSFKNRVDLQDRQMKDGDVSLILKDVMTADGGSYKCGVLVGESASWEIMGTVNMSVAPPGHTKDGSKGQMNYLSGSEQKTITAESGQKKVTLTCGALNKNIILVEWSREGLDPEYVLVYRGGKFDPENQHPSFKNRVDLQDRQMKDGDVSLILKNVTINDTGTYKCHVKREGDIYDSIKLISIIYLRVDPPVQPEHTKDGGKKDIPVERKTGLSFIGGIVSDFILCSVKRSTLILQNYRDNAEQKTITAESGQKKATLTCGGLNKNIILVEWSREGLDPEYVLVYRGGQFDPENQHPSFKNRVDLQDRQMKDGDVSLILKDVTINDTGTYKCHVMTEGDSMKLISIIYLRVDPPGEQSSVCDQR
ncbi:unnamed protein product [Oreochromis niloticus]|nr:unnamed protein product [Mustela putorius furo]